MSTKIMQEEFGMVTRAQLACYRKYNVSPSDHDMITQVFGITDEAAIITHILRNLRNGIYCVPLGGMR